ncbi:polysaccharide pyruvyl transferase family protein [Arcticibacter sp.]|uniref:polysaccharide pyruvyl transferase family protein n=1 Tax=Arcticibacter sp. TaxID=1872630 RepID=UPI00388DC2A6
MQDRRTFIRSLSAVSLTVMLAPITEVVAANPGRRKRILIRSGWQTVNIGDIGHTFGLLAIIERYLPELDLVLWPKAYDRGVEDLLRKTFPKITIVKSGIDEVTPELKKAFDECVFMIHGSGPYVTAKKELTAWRKNTGKPFGIYGVSLDEVDPALFGLIAQASFFYCRDTESLKYLKTLNNPCPVQGFAPDSTFGIKIYDDQKAKTYLDAVGLKKGEFICVIPRLRFTPYWQMVGRAPSTSEKERYAISMAFKERDGAKLREVMVTWIKNTGLKVLVCPEVTQQVELGKEVLYDPLPEDLKKNVVWRSSFWLPDEATSVYKHARAMVCCEPHSLIMAVANGIPSIHIKQSTDTRKGQMWRDIGMGDWYFLMDETPASQISQQLLQIHNNYDIALESTNKAMNYVESIQKKTMKNLRQLIR